MYCKCQSVSLSGLVFFDLHHVQTFYLCEVIFSGNFQRIEAQSTDVKTNCVTQSWIAGLVVISFDFCFFFLFFPRPLRLWDIKDGNIYLFFLPLVLNV